MLTDRYEKHGSLAQSLLRNPTMFAPQYQAVQFSARAQPWLIPMAIPWLIYIKSRHASLRDAETMHRDSALIGFVDEFSRMGQWRLHWSNTL